MADIIYIDGIGKSYKERLVARGLGTIETFLAKLQGSPAAVAQLAADIKVKEAQVQAWYAHARVFQLSEMNSAYFNLLNAAHVRALETLVDEGTASLKAKIKALVAADVSRPMPSDELLAQWLQDAQDLLAGKPISPLTIPTRNAVDPLAPTPKTPKKETKTESASQTNAKTSATPPKAPVNLMEVIVNYSQRAAAAAAIPIPVGDLVAVAEVQHEMLRKIAEAKGVHFSMSGATAAIEGLAPAKSSWTTLTSAVKIVPIFGAIVGGASGAYLHAVTTFAIGSTLLDHFNRKGTFENFNVAKSKASFEQHQKFGEMMLRGKIGQKLGMK
jgi:uncharacterized protein (DUF697 family)